LVKGLVLRGLGDAPQDLLPALANLWMEGLHACAADEEDAALGNLLLCRSLASEGEEG
jgi:hypothetical protein